MGITGLPARSRVTVKTWPNVTPVTAWRGAVAWRISTPLVCAYLWRARCSHGSDSQTTAVGTSTGVVIPKEMLNRMKVERGDSLHVIETPDGYLLTPYDPKVAEQVEAGREFMKDNRDVFKALAK